LNSSNQPARLCRISESSDGISVISESDDEEIQTTVEPEKTNIQLQFRRDHDPDRASNDDEDISNLSTDSSTKSFTENLKFLFLSFFFVFIVVVLFAHTIYLENENQMLRSVITKSQKQPEGCVEQLLEVYKPVRSFDFYVNEKVESLSEEIEEIIRNRSVK
jgi:hypothetical protein